MAVFQTENLWVSQAAEGVATLFLDVAGRPLNVLSRQVLAELEQALERIETDTSFQVLHVRSGKEGNFVAGADVHEFTKIATPEQARNLSEQGQKLFTRLANLRLPTVAIIGGACLGGGLELALACDYRVVLDDSRVQLGLPEVELGLLPGWGGTQRLPRAVGLERGLQMILSGRRLRAREAVQLGLADALSSASDADRPPLPGPLVKRPLTALPRRGWRGLLFEGTAPGRWLIFRATERILRQRVPDDMPAPWEALQAVRVGLAQGLEAGLAYEREASGRLAVSTACRNLVDVFFRQQEARKLPEAVADGPKIHKVGVVGAGTMGAGIAQLAALRKHDVVVQELDETALGMGMLRIVALFNQAAQRGLLSSQELTQRMSLIHGSTSWKRFDDLDLVIEAVIEDLEAKKAIFRQIEEHVGPDTILATNTSSLRVQHLQDGLHHPGRVAGLHFFNPVHKMPLVEVVRSPATRATVAAGLMRFVVALGKTPVLVNDSPGFLVNRVLMPYLNEAVLLVSQGMPIVVVDQALRKFGMPVGPLELLDQIGLDVAAHIARAMTPVFGERWQPHPGFELMVSKGWLGDKTRVGFYRTRPLRKKPNPLAENALRQQTDSKALRLQRLPRKEQLQLAQESLVGLMVNEAAACLGEKVVEDAATLDLALILGVGWAPHRGGPMKYGRDRGLAEIVVRLNRLAEQYGERFRPCAELERLAGMGHG